MFGIIELLIKKKTATNSKIGPRVCQILTYFNNVVCAAALSRRR